jgi:ArpU family phage transcriptional regulator
MEWIRHGVNLLSPRERELIIKRYLNNEGMYDYKFYNEMEISVHKYYRIKLLTFYKIACALKIGFNHL